MTPTNFLLLASNPQTQQTGKVSETALQETQSARIYAGKLNVYHHVKRCYAGSKDPVTAPTENDNDNKLAVNESVS